MKKFYLVFVFITSLLFAGYSQTMFKFSEYNTIRLGTTSPVFTMYTNSYFTDKLSFTNYFYVNGNPKGSWGQGLVGLSYNFTKGIKVGLLGGIQSNEPELGRVSPIINMSNEHLSFFGAFEVGGRRDRWDAIALYKWQHVRLGGELIRFYKMYAVGPRLEVTFIKKQPVNLFYSALWDYTYGNYVSMFGIFTSFSGK